MNNKNQKFRFRILPVFIFVAGLTLTFKINSVFDRFNHPEQPKIQLSSTKAQAEEQTVKETAALTKMLGQGGPDQPANVENPNTAFSQSEILILQELAERREALDVRAKEIDKRAIQLKVAEDEIDKKLKQLKAYESKLEKLIQQYSKKEQENINSLVKLYTSMKPKDAARIFNTLDMDITVALLKGMKPSASSAILSQMNSEKAKAVTSQLIGNNI